MTLADQIPPSSAAMPAVRHGKSRLRSGMEIAWSRAGDEMRTPLLLVHGITDNRATWAPITRALHEVAPEISWVSQDLRGHGGSSLPVLPPSNHLTAEGFRLADYAADAVGLLDALGIEQAIYVGHSLGGLVGQEVALTYPERLRGLVMVTTTTNSRDNPVFVRDVVGDLFGRRLPALAQAKGLRYPDGVAGFTMRQLDPSLMTWLRDLWCVTPNVDPALCAAAVEWTADIPLATWFGAFTGLLEMDTTARLADIRVPSLVVSAARDEIFPVEPDQRVLEHAMSEAHRRHGTVWRSCTYRAVASSDNQRHDVGHALPWQATTELVGDIAAFVKLLGA
ncbi:alpha/beta fold hydrolase [Hypericibacter sp.]|uniref:alpha/beta fold hydrolase n=1 Tax=Hypericibacter sp. TaxID=2705401 RepID=UPI003D6D07F6